MMSVLRERTPFLFVKLFFTWWQLGENDACHNDDYANGF